MTAEIFYILSLLFIIIVINNFLKNVHVPPSAACLCLFTAYTHCAILLTKGIWLSRILNYDISEGWCWVWDFPNVSIKSLYAVRGEYPYQDWGSVKLPLTLPWSLQYSNRPTYCPSLYVRLWGPEARGLTDICGHYLGIFSQFDDGGDGYQINAVFPLHSELSELFINLLAATDR